MDLTPAQWSAIAAIGSVICAIGSVVCAFMLMRVHRTNMLENVRPDLWIEGWKRAFDPRTKNLERITFSRVRNVGRGVAIHGAFFGEHPWVEGELPTHHVHGPRFFAIAPGETRELSGEISVYWDNVPETPNSWRYVHVELKGYVWNAHGDRYTLSHSLMIEPHDPNAHVQQTLGGGAVELAPGVNLSTRSQQRERVWWLQAKRWILSPGERLKRLWRTRRAKTQAAD